MTMTLQRSKFGRQNIFGSAVLNNPFTQVELEILQNYPFAPRCLGVAAKRSLEYDFNNRVPDDISNRAAPFDIYSTLIKRVLDEAKRQKPALPTAEDPNRPYDGSSLFDKLASLIDKPQSQLFDTDAYSDGTDNWNTRFNGNERGL